MDLVIEWSDQPLNLAAIRAVLREVEADEAPEGEGGQVPEGSDLPPGLVR